MVTECESYVAPRLYERWQRLSASNTMLGRVTKRAVPFLVQRSLRRFAVRTLALLIGYLG